MKNLQLFIFFVIIISTNVDCQILRVPENYSTIQSAINDTKNGDTVLVSEGTYFENINFRGKNIVVASNYIITKEVQTIENTIIDGSQYRNLDSASCVSLLNGEDSTAVIEGFKITGGKGTKYQWPNGSYDQEGAGVIISESYAIVRNNIIIDNISTPGPGTGAGGGGGISAMYGKPGIYNNLIVSNSAGYAAGLVLNWSGGKIKNNIIYNNYGGERFGTGGVMIWESPSNSVIIENNIIIGNISAKDAGGLRIRTATSADNYSIKNNIIWYNRQEIGNQVNGEESYLNYNNIEDYSEGTNISVIPLFENESFLVPDSSLLIDAGDPDSMYYDLIEEGSSDIALFPSKGSLRNDIGAFGGQFTSILPSIKIENIIFSSNHLKVDIFDNSEKFKVIEILKLGFEDAKIDSITNIDSASVKVQNNLNSKNIAPWESDSIYVTLNPKSDGTYYDTLKVFHNLANVVNPKKITIEIRKITFTDVHDKKVSTEFNLDQNYPNPFNPTTNIKFSIPESQNVTLKVYDLLGREVAVLVNEKKTEGTYSIELNASKLSSGVYFYQLNAGNLSMTKKLLLLE